MKTDNELIAEFMGKDIGHERMIIFDKGWTLIKYHTSWDWLMPVVEKIESLGNNVEIWHKAGIQGCRIDRMCTDIFENGDDNKKISAVYKAVVEFIKWYNFLNKTK